MQSSKSPDWKKFGLITGLDKSGYQVHIFLISLVSPQWGTSNEYSQHTFLCRNKKNINTFGLEKASSQEVCQFCRSYSPSQICHFIDLLPKLFKPSWFLKKHGRKAWGLVSLCIFYTEIFKIFLSETTWLIQKYNSSEVFLWWPSAKLIQAIMMR